MDTEDCTHVNCGCRIETYPTQEDCPECAGKLRLSGQSQLVKYRLYCQHCGYQSHILTQEELYRIF